MMMMIGGINETHKQGAAQKHTNRGGEQICMNSGADGKTYKGGKEKYTKGVQKSAQEGVEICTK